MLIPKAGSPPFYSMFPTKLNLKLKLKTQPRIRIGPITKTQIRTRLELHRWLESELVLSETKLDVELNLELDQKIDDK